MAQSKWNRRRVVAMGAGLLFAAAAGGIMGCADDDPMGMSQEERELTELLRQSYEFWPLPEEAPYPPDNGPANAGYAERVALGRLLFYDPLISGDDDVACATCHHAALAWADARPLSIGVGGEGLGPDRVRTLMPSEWEFITPRNSPTVLDTAFNAPFPGGAPWEGKMFWDARTTSLESQARAPIRSRDEMRHDAYPSGAAVTAVVTELRAIDEYVQRFTAAFADEAAALPESSQAQIIDGNTYSRALAAYERELRGGDSPYDRFARGDDTALSLSQKRGLQLFFEEGCADCHHGPMFSDFGFYVLGSRQGGPGKPPVHEHGNDAREDTGRFLEDSSDETMRYAFRTPSLRNVALTAPYFHAGGEESGGDYQTLRQVIDFFDRGCNDQGLEAFRLAPGLSQPMGLSEQQKDDLVAFLQSLTATRLVSPFIDGSVPDRVPSGLEPPGAGLPPVLTR